VLQSAFKKLLTRPKVAITTSKKAGPGGKGRGRRSSDSSESEEGGGASEDEELAKMKSEWQAELETMSDFLVLKSTEEQKEEGLTQLVDTATVEDRDGMPVFRAFFDVRCFQPDEVTL
jgi:hypothetical protein